METIKYGASARINHNGNGLMFLDLGYFDTDIEAEKVVVQHMKSINFEEKNVDVDYVIIKYTNYDTDKENGEVVANYNIDSDPEKQNFSPEEEAQINEMYEKVCLALKKIEN